MAKKTSPIVTVRFVENYPLSRLIVDRAFNKARKSEEYNKSNPEMAERIESIKALGVRQPVVISEPGDDKGYLDAGFMRVTAAGYAGRDTVPALVYERGLDDPGRAESNAIENAYKPPTWWGSAQVALGLTDALSPKDVALRMSVSEKHVKSLVNAARKLSDYVQKETLPEDAPHTLTWRDAKELTTYPKGEVVDAWNAFVKSGKVPPRGEKLGNRGGGRRPAGDAWGKKDALAKLKAEDETVDWEKLSKNFPPRNQEQLDAVLSAIGFSADDEGDEAAES